MHDLLFAKLASPGDRPTVVQHEAGRKPSRVSSAQVSRSLFCAKPALAPNKYAGMAYREARDGNGPTRVGYMAHWDEENCNPALAGFLKLLRERYSLLPETN